MNDRNESSGLRPMELKYCERCGSLWLRRIGSRGAECAPCARAAAILLQYPAGFLQFWSQLRAEVRA